MFRKNGSMRVPGFRREHGYTGPWPMRRMPLPGRMTRAMNDIRKGIPYIPSDPGFYREDGPVDWLRTQEGVWLHSTFPFNTRWTLDASRMGPRPFMRRLTPIGFGDLDQYGGVSGDVGFWFDDRGRLLWLRTVEGIWLVADMEAPYWWTLDVNNMPAVDMARLRPATLAEAVELCADYDDMPAIRGPLDTYDGIAATFGEPAELNERHMV